MRFKPTSRRTSGAKLQCAGFTLAEVLAALTFMAIVIPVAVAGLRLASAAGQIGERKSVAGRLAERVLNEIIVTGQWKDSSPNGIIRDGVQEYRWKARTENWSVDALRVVTVQVVFSVQGHDYDVNLSTLVDSTLP